MEIGKIISKGILKAEWIGSGWGFKSQKAFDSGKGVCYIPENSIYKRADGISYYKESYCRSDFERLVKKYLKAEGGIDKNSVELVEKLFNESMWQYPETIIADWGGDRDDKIKMSVMSGKLKGIPSLNTSPLDNPFCLKNSQIEGLVCRHCYSIATLKRYGKNVRERFKKNGIILSEKIIPEEELPLVNARFIRIHSHGELLNDIHFKNIVNFAKKNYWANVALWTKRVDIVTPLIDIVPDNLILVYSTPRLNDEHPSIPNGFHKVFTVYTKKYIGSHPKLKINCGGRSCMNCLKCYKKDAESFINEKVK